MRVDLRLLRGIQDLPQQIGLNDKRSHEGSRQHGPDEAFAPLALKPVAPQFQGFNLAFLPAD